MITLLVIADDFTGALDTGVQFSKRGIPTIVKMIDSGNQSDILNCAGDYEVMAVDLETRHLPPGKAAERVSALIRQALGMRITYIYKKTDSTLRGNIGAELSAMLNAIPANELAFIPAYPQANRVTVNGEHFVNRVPLNNTEFARDPLNPVRHANVESIIREQSDVHTRHISFMQYKRLLDDPPEENTLSVVDARSEEDLRKIGNILSKAGKLQYLAGCAGFAELLPQLLNLRSERRKDPAPGEEILVASGSVNPIASRQVDYAKEKCGYHYIEFTSEQLVEPDEAWMEQWLSRLDEALDRTGKVILQVPQQPEKRRRTDAIAAKMGIPPEEVSRNIVRRIGNIVKRILDRRQVGTLVIFGGDTLRGIIGSLKSTGIRPTVEIAPGVVSARLVGSRYNQAIITKAGGLGEEYVLRQIDMFLSPKKEKDSYNENQPEKR